MRLFLVALAATVAVWGQVSYEQIRKGMGAEWLTYAGDYSGSGTAR